MGKLLLDTHTLPWFLWDDPQLSENAKSLIENPENQKLVSIATCWDIAIKVGLRKLDLGSRESTRAYLHREIYTNNLELLTISFMPHGSEACRSTIKIPSIAC
jgi:PIN domain nuclease of toxin-antitoxin system